VETLRATDLDESNKGQQGCLSNLKFLCEKLDAAAAAIFQKLPNTTPSLADLATAFRFESVQAVLDDISTTSANKRRRIDQLHWTTVARSLREFHISSKRQKLPSQPLQPGYIDEASTADCLRKECKEGRTHASWQQERRQS
jgi:hypothetical protein